MQLVQERLGHERRRGALAVQVAQLRAERVTIADSGIHAVSDARNVRHLGEIVAAAAAPDQDVVGQVADHAVGGLLLGDEAAAEGGDVLVVPGVAVRDRGAVGNASDLIAVVPPGHDTRVLGGVVAEPKVRLAVVVHQHLGAVAQLGVEHDGRVGHGHGHLLAVAEEVGAADNDDIDEEDCEDAARGAVLFVRDLGLAEERIKLRAERALLGGRGRDRGLLLGRSLLGAVGLLGASLGIVRGLVLGVVLLLAVGLGGRGGAEEVELIDRPLEEQRHRHARERGGHGAEKDDEAHHLGREEVGDGAVEAQKVLAVMQTEEDAHKADRGKVAGRVQVLVVGVGAGGLVLGDRVHERVASASVLHEEATHARGERAEVAGGVERGGHGGRDAGAKAEGLHAELEDLVRVGDLLDAAIDVDGVEELHDAEDAERADLLERLERREANHRDLDGAEGADRVEECVGPVELD
mmetsp:Transcript_10448/g.33382  ORF Transcript_10448/g.33382 Transcript_10448/m.33382 type:complete len:466 (+) Transcript_10448:423-1820(+)